MNSKQGGQVAVDWEFSQEMEVSETPLCIPKRKNPKVGGTSGRHIEIEVNYFEINLEEFFKKTVYHMNVKFSPQKPIQFLREALEEFSRKYYGNINFAFDGSNNMYTTTRVEEKNGLVTIVSKRGGKTLDFHIISSFVKELPMNKIREYFLNGSSGPTPKNELQILNTIMKNRPLSIGFVSIGKSLLQKPPIVDINMTEGMEMWKGFFHRLYVGWKPYLNIDVVHKNCPKFVPMLLYVTNELQFDINNPLDSATFKALEFLVSGLKIVSTVPNRSSTKRYFHVRGLLDTPFNLRVSWNFKYNRYRRSTNQTLLTVVDFFKIIYKYTIKYPHLPCLHVGRRTDTVCIPIEFCSVLNGKLRRINANTNVPLLETQHNIIENFINTTKYNEDPVLKEFSISVDNNFASIPARVLSPPKIIYAENKNVSPKSRGVWKIDKCFKGAILSDWIVLNLDQSIKVGYIKNFEQKLIHYGKCIDINIMPNSCVFNLSIPKKTSIDKIRQLVTPFFSSHQNNTELQLVLVILPKHSKEIYGIVKQVSELDVGILTQCIMSKNILQTIHSKSIITNILLKINTKLNGVNHVVAVENCMEGVMILGAIKIYQSSDVYKIPSFATVVANHDLTGSQYNMEWCLQSSNAQDISNLKDIIYKQLLKFQNETKTVPKKLIYLRRYINTGQFKHFLKTELVAIQQACLMMDKKYKPPITFVGVQKQKHTKMFPKKFSYMDVGSNVLPGTVIDTQITHPTEHSFYLCSHFNNQGGTTKPIKYHIIWDDSDFTEDQLQRMILNTCYMFTSSTNSISYPAPMYYAQLAAHRARNYLKYKQIDFNRLHPEQEKIVLNELVSKTNPMFFI